MFVLRVVVAATLLFLLGLAIAYALTRDRRYARIAFRTVLAVLALLLGFGLLYVFERVLLMV